MSADVQQIESILRLLRLARLSQCALVKTFQALKELHSYRRRHLAFLKTVEDLEIIVAIGDGQAAGRPIMLKALYLEGIGSAATIQRRLVRLRRLGAVATTHSRHDKRILTLTLSPQVCAIYTKIGRLLRAALA